MAQGADSTVSLNQPIHDKDISKLSPLEIMEDSLVFFADSMYDSAIPEYRIEGSYVFITGMKNFLRTPNSFSHDCKKLSEKISIVKSPDNEFKLYTWEVLRGSSDIRYYGVIQLKDGSYTPLVDVSESIIRGAEDSTFTGTRWYGCIYYNILIKELDGQKIYFLLGWNGSSMNSEKKIIEAFGFNSQGQSRFGAPLFNIIERGKRRTVNRYLYEYQKGSKASLNFEKESNLIMMDHCESQIGDPAKRFTYIPDGTYDGFSWDGTKWIMQENVKQILELQQGNAPVEKPIK
jgi:hypothetical protein